MISWSLNKAGNAVIHTAAGSCFWPMCDIGMFESIQFLHVSPNSSKTGMGEWMHRRRPELTLMNDMHLSQTQRSLELHRLQDLWNPVFIEFLPRCSLTLYIFIAECLSWIDRYQIPDACNNINTHDGLPWISYMVFSSHQPESVIKCHYIMPNPSKRAVSHDRYSLQSSSTVSFDSSKCLVPEPMPLTQAYFAFYINTAICIFNTCQDAKCMPSLAVRYVPKLELQCESNALVSI